MVAPTETTYIISGYVGDDNEGNVSINTDNISWNFNYKQYNDYYFF